MLVNNNICLLLTNDKHTIYSLHTAFIKLTNNGLFKSMPPGLEANY